jgi:hypothetical protein
MLGVRLLAAPKLLRQFQRHPPRKHTRLVRRVPHSLLPCPRAAARRMAQGPLTIAYRAHVGRNQPHIRRAIPQPRARPATRFYHARRPRPLRIHLREASATPRSGSSGGASLAKFPCHLHSAT